MINSSYTPYGKLINKDTLLYRKYFAEAVKLLGINCQYRAPQEGKAWDLRGDLETKYYEPIMVGVIFEEFPNPKTLKKMGWATELQEGSSIVHVPYDLEHLQVGALFTIPSPVNPEIGRTFRVIAMQSIMIYPASIACEIAPEYETTEEFGQNKDFTKTNFNALLDNEEDD